MPTYIVYKLVEIGRVHDCATAQDAWRLAEETFGDQAASVRMLTTPEDPPPQGKTLAEVFAEEAQPKRKEWHGNQEKKS